MSSLLIAIYVPNITVVINYLGALAGAFMFVFPGLCLMFYSLDRSKLNESSDSIGSYTSNSIDIDEEDKKYRRTSNLLLLLSVTYVTFGAFIMALVVTQSFLKSIEL